MGTRRVLMIGLRRPRGGVEREVVPGRLAAFLTAGFGPEAREVVAEDLDAWGLTEDVAFAMAREHLRLASHRRQWHQHPDIPSIHMYAGGPGRASARMLVLSDLLTPAPVAGVVVAVPADDQLLAIPLQDLDALAAVEVLATAARIAWQDAARPISDQLYWTDGDRWELLAVEHSGDVSRVVGSPGLEAAAARLMALSLARGPAVA